MFQEFVYLISRAIYFIFIWNFLKISISLPSKCSQKFFFSLTGSRYRYQYDPKAFLFSLVNKPGWAPVKLPQTGILGSSRAYSLFFYYSYGPTFGGGHDIYISNYASSNANSASNLGHTYSPPRGYSHGTTFTQTFLAGSYRFTPDEIETFYETT